MGDMNSSQGELAETWRINHRINLRLLDALTDEQLAATILRRGKTVTSYFVHIHMARFYWLQRRSRALAKGVKKIPGGTASRAPCGRHLSIPARPWRSFLPKLNAPAKSRAPNWGLWDFSVTRSPTKATTADRS